MKLWRCDMWPYSSESVSVIGCNCGLISTTYGLGTSHHTEASIGPTSIMYNILEITHSAMYLTLQTLDFDKTRLSLAPRSMAVDRNTIIWFQFMLPKPLNNY